MAWAVLLAESLSDLEIFKIGKTLTCNMLLPFGEHRKKNKEF